jgi:hypothetical protein
VCVRVQSSSKRCARAAELDTAARDRPPPARDIYDPTPRCCWRATCTVSAIPPAFLFVHVVRAGAGGIAKLHRTSGQVAPAPLPTETSPRAPGTAAGREDLVQPPNTRQVSPPRKRRLSGGGNCRHLAPALKPRPGQRPRPTEGVAQKEADDQTGQLTAPETCTMPTEKK